MNKKRQPSVPRPSFLQHPAREFRAPMDKEIAPERIIEDCFVTSGRNVIHFQHDQQDPDLIHYAGLCPHRQFRELY